MSVATQTTDSAPARPLGASKSKIHDQSDSSHEYDPADCVTPDDNRKFDDSELEDILPSIDRDGQLVDGIVSRHPTLPGKLVVVAGCRRKRCCEILGRPFRAKLIDRVLPRTEVIRIRVKENVLRKNPSPFELCAEVCDYKNERKLETWMEVGEELNLLPPVMSRITSVRHIPPELKDKAEQVCPSACWIIATLRNNIDAMRQAFDFATAPGQDGKLPSREAVRRFVATLKKKGKGRSSGKVRTIPLRMNGRVVTVAVSEKDSATSVAEDLKAIVATLGKHAHIKPEGWPFLFQ